MFRFIGSVLINENFNNPCSVALVDNKHEKIFLFPLDYVGPAGLAVLFCKTLQGVFVARLTCCCCCTVLALHHNPPTLFARLQWAVPPLQHLQAAFTANAELPRSLVRCLAALCTGSRQWPYVETLETLLHATPASPALSPRSPFSQTHDGSCLIAAVIRRIAMPNIFSR